MGCETKFRIQHMAQLEALKSIYTTMETVLQGNDDLMIELNYMFGRKYFELKEFQLTENLLSATLTIIDNMENVDDCYNIFKTYLIQGKIYQLLGRVCMQKEEYLYAEG